VIIGETTFGKGSVQMLFDIQSPVPFGNKGDDDKLGLKLTTAQYLTPGDTSIQGVGVTPDVELVRMRVEKKNDEAWINLQNSTRRRQESDYEWHLVSSSVRKGTKPDQVVPYLYVPSAAELRRKVDQDEIDANSPDDDDGDVAEPEEDRIDFPITLARDLLAQARTARRQDLVESSKALFDKVRADEDKRLSAALEKLGVDWSAGPGNQAPGEIQVTLATAADEAQAKAGNAIKIRGTVKNVGTTPVYRVRAVLRSDNPLFDENEMVFGKVAPGSSKTYDLTVKAPKSSLTRTDVIQADISGQGTVKANNPELTLNIEGKAHPLFAYSYQTIDDVAGNRDGQVQRGERVRTLVKVKNIGQGAALRTEAILRNGAGQEGILISAGRFDTKDLAPGASRTFNFVYEVGQDFRGDEYQLELVVADTVLGESVTDKIKVKLAPAGPSPAAEDQTVTVTRSQAVVREAPSDNALVVGQAPKGTAWKSTGRIGAFHRVEIESGRPAFVAAADVAPGGAVQGSLVPKWQVTPPVLVVTAPTVVPGNTVHIKATASDDSEVKDVYIRVWNRDSKLPPKKVFYLPNKGDKTRLAFEADVPLWPGSNLVQVFARETNEIQSVQTVVVLDRGAATVVQKTGGAAGPMGK
jgi:carboxyl-terminal processing protease